MKKSIAIILALILMMTVIFVGCGKKEEESEKEETTAQQTGENTNATQGNVPSSGDSQENETTGADNTETTGATESTDPTDITKDEENTEPSKPDVTPSQPDNSQKPVTPVSSRIDKYRQIFASGTYSMSVVTVGDSLEDMPMTVSCKNGNVRMEMSMEGMPIIMIYMGENDTVYMLFEILGKFYSEITPEMLGEDLDFSQITDGFKISENGAVTEGTAEFDGKTVITETIESEGKTSVYYFDEAGNLLGGETTDENGEVSVMKISNLTTTVDDSLFEIPSDYKYMDMSWIMNMA